MNYISNSFSLQMIDLENYEVRVEAIRKEDVPSDAYSVVGHADTATVLGVKFNRESIKLERGDVLYVAQVIGGRLPEGSTTLPEGFQLKYLKLQILD